MSNIVDITIAIGARNRKAADATTLNANISAVLLSNCSHVTLAMVNRNSSGFQYYTVYIGYVRVPTLQKMGQRRDLGYGKI